MEQGGNGPPDVRTINKSEGVALEAEGFGPAGGERHASRGATPNPAEPPTTEQREGVALEAEGFEPYDRAFLTW
jgi:hypothetical protein